MKGAAMGVAEVIPGVSGGTIAFITGIYEKLLESISAFGPSLISLFRKEGFGAVWNKVNGNFLVFLVFGMGIGVVVGRYAIMEFLVKYPPIVWSFFFGLIIASIIYVGKQISKRDFIRVIAFILGTAIAYGITEIPLAETNESLWFIFLAGALAISALILPGISGSFILLILGLYQYIVHDSLGGVFELDPQAILTMLCFGGGVILGLATFSRVVSWVYKNYHDTTLAVLSGFMLGALNAIWPWRIPQTIMMEDGSVTSFVKGIEIDKVILDANALPAQYEALLGEPSFVVASIVSLIAGIAIVLILDRNTKVAL